ncbi:MAG: hypothetical protein H8D34_27600 [Chloroflexi bacterium]|nr:hypothetical protein [Chloroflexota bacterium]
MITFPKQKTPTKADILLRLGGGDMIKAIQVAKESDKLDYQMMLALQGGYENSWEVVKELEKERPDCPRCAFNRGFHFLAKGRFQEGLELLELGRELDVWGNVSTLGGMIQPQWNGESLKDKSILVFMEGGDGDKIINIRFVKQLKEMGANVIISSPIKLVKLFASMGNYTIVQQEVLKGVWHDYWIPSFSLPRVLKLEEKDLYSEPYITADPKYIDKMSRLIKSDKLKVGIRWRGSAAHEHEQFRRFPFADFLNAVDQEHVDLYSLQLSDCSDIDLKKHPQINNLEWALKSWEDTAGAIANLDLVITSCTSVAHLSAAMGKPTWIIVPILPYYIWAQAGNKSPWYDSVTLYRQATYNEWDKPLNEIRHNLKNLR